MGLHACSQCRPGFPGSPTQRPAAITPESDASADTGNDGYPVLRRYTDSHHLPPMSEPTIAEAARSAVAYGLLRTPVPPPQQKGL